MDEIALREYLHKKFLDRRHASLQRVTHLLSELGLSTIKDIKELNLVIDNTRSAIEKFEKDNPNRRAKDGKYPDEGIVRLSVDLVDENFRLNRGARFLTNITDYRKYIKR